MTAWDDATTAALVARLVRAGITVATAESCTGGMLAARLTDPAGASAVYVWGAVTYSNAAKTSVLGVGRATLDAHGAVSEAVAAEMAEGALARSGATLAVAVTGIAGPGGSGHKPEGRVCFALGTAEGVETETREFGALGRAGVRTAARDYALSLIDRAAAQRRRAP